MCNESCCGVYREPLHCDTISSTAPLLPTDRSTERWSGHKYRYVLRHPFSADGGGRNEAVVYALSSTVIEIENRSSCWCQSQCFFFITKAKHTDLDLLFQIRYAWQM